MHNVQFFILNLETSVKWYFVSTPNQMLPTWKMVKWKLTNKLLLLIKKTKYFTLYQNKKVITDSESTNVFSLILLALLKGAG